MSCMTILFLNVQITRSDIRPHMKWVINLVIAYGHFNLPQRFVCYVRVDITPKGRLSGEDEHLKGIQCSVHDPEAMGWNLGWV